MARELTSGSGGNFPPSLKLTRKAGSRFVGILDGNRETSFGDEFTFKVVEGDAFIGKPTGEKNEKGHNILAEVDVAPGDKVALTTTKGGQLEAKLKQAIIGEKVEIVFKGGKLNPKSGRTFNDYSVSVLD